MTKSDYLRSITTSQFQTFPRPLALREWTNWSRGPLAKRPRNPWLESCGREKIGVSGFSRSQAFPAPQQFCKLKADRWQSLKRRVSRKWMGVGREKKNCDKNPRHCGPCFAWENSRDFCFEIKRGNSYTQRKILRSKSWLVEILRAERVKNRSSGRKMRLNVAFQSWRRLGKPGKRGN